MEIWLWWRRSDGMIDPMTHPWYTPPVALSVPPSWTLSLDDKEELEEQTWAMILLGQNEIEEFTQYFEEEIEEAGISQDEANSYFETVVAARRVQQVALGGIPQSALTNAFAELETLGVVARESFTCCGTCGDNEIWHERDDSRAWRGYVYYHVQDAEHIPQSRSTHIAYGGFVDQYFTRAQWEEFADEEKDSHYTRIVTELMNNEVVPVLQKHGIDVSWSGALDKRILLDGVDFFAAV